MAPTGYPDDDRRELVGATPVGESGGVFPIGETEVTCTATNDYGNTSPAQIFNVQVNDVSKPVLSNQHAGLTLETSSSEGAVVSEEISPFDVSDYTATTTACTRDDTNAALGSAPYTFPKGTTTISCTATDAYANSETSSFTVLVEDKTSPVLTAPAHPVDQPQIVEADGASTSVAYTVSATDDYGAEVSCSVNTEGASAGLTSASLPLGLSTITCTATDPSGNEASASFHVQVRDSLKPVLAAVLQADITAEATGASGKSVAFTAPSATDKFAVTVECKTGNGATITSPHSFYIGTTAVSQAQTHACGSP